MNSIVRDSAFGHLVHYATSGRIFPWAEERADYKIPERYLATKSSPSSTLRPLRPEEELEKGSQQPAPAAERPLPPSRTSSIATVVEAAAQEPRPLKPAELEAGKSEDSRYTLVDWDGPMDSDNPMNWSSSKKSWVTFQICLMTFAVYAGSAIYTPAIPGVMDEFGVSQVAATLGLSLFVLGYGVGPLVLTPLQELPFLGRNPGYIITLLLFIIFQLPIVFSNNFACILVFRFLTGVLGSPALATGGASISDLWPTSTLAEMIGVWALGACSGPVFGPVLGSFPAMVNGWRWSIYVLMMLSGISFVGIFFSLPETLASTILLRRARRLRKVSGNQNLRSQSEIDSENLRLGQVFAEALYMPFRLLLEPAVFVTSLYLGLVYALFYLFFESYPIVFQEIHHFNLGTSTLPFIAFAVVGLVTYFGYVIYQRKRIGRLYENGTFVAEHRLEIGVLSSFSVPAISLLFGWTARESIHWFAPLVFGSLFLAPVFLAFQSILLYLATAYPKHQGSVFAANDLLRSTLASVFPLFGSKLYKNLGLGPGSSLLAGLAALLIPIFWLIKHHGARLRQLSKYAE